MKVAMIVVNYNASQDVTSNIEKARRYDSIDRIVIVDNKSSREDELRILKELENEKVIVIESDKNGGYAYGNNFGINYLEKTLNEQYDYYIISNPDIEISEEAIKKTLECLESDPSYGVAAPRMYDKTGRPIRRSAWKERTFIRDVVHSTRLLELLFYKVLRDGEYSEEDYKNEYLEVDCLSGAFFIIKSKAYHDIYKFDDELFLFYQEDVLHAQLDVNNYKTICLSNEKFIHYESQTIDKTFNYFVKMNKLFKAKMHYQVGCNNIKTWQKIVFYILYVFKNIELLIEVPIRKLLKK